MIEFKSVKGAVITQCREDLPEDYWKKLDHEIRKCGAGPKLHNPTLVRRGNYQRFLSYIGVKKYGV